MMNVSTRIEEIVNKLKSLPSELPYKDVLTSIKAQIIPTNQVNISLYSKEIVDVGMTCKDTIPNVTMFKDVKLPNKEILLFDKPVILTDRGLDGLISSYNQEKQTITILGITHDELNQLRFNAAFEFPIDLSLEQYFGLLTENLYNSLNPSNCRLSGYHKTRVEVEQICKFYLSLLSWRENKISSSIELPIERHTRKRIKNAYRSYYLVTLRKRESNNNDSPLGESNFSCRWVVSGHFRRQYYPSIENHKLIFISPFIKGPDNMPLKEKTNALIIVNR